MATNTRTALETLKNAERTRIERMLEDLTLGQLADLRRGISDMVYNNESNDAVSAEVRHYET
jgi:hypothetical protein